MKWITLALIVLGLGCGDVQTSALKLDAGEPKEGDAAAPDKVDMAGSRIEAQADAGGDADDASPADAGQDVDAMTADADGSDGVAEVAEAGAETPIAHDVVSGTWSFNVVPNAGHGQMILTLRADAVSGTYECTSCGPNNYGTGTIAGTVAGDDIKLTWMGTLAGTYSGAITDGRIADGVAMVAAGRFQFIAQYLH